MNKEQLTTRLNELTSTLNRLAIHVYKVREEIKALTQEVSTTPAPATHRDCAVDHNGRPFTIRFIYKGEVRN